MMFFKHVEGSIEFSFIENLYYEIEPFTALWKETFKHNEIKDALWIS